MHIQVFDPPMCCASGVCGPAPDPTLIRAAEVLEHLKADGHTVVRYQLSHHPAAFTETPEVYRILLNKGSAALPITVVDGVVRWVGRYPDYEEMLEAAGETGPAQS